MPVVRDTQLIFQVVLGFVCIEACRMLEDLVDLCRLGEAALTVD
jgi:hypothetical protein